MAYVTMKSVSSEMKRQGTSSGQGWLLRRGGLPSVGLSYHGARSSMRPSSRQANRDCCFGAGNFSSVKERRAQQCCRPKRTTLGRTGLPLEHNWIPYMGKPLEQEVPGTCALAAVSLCLAAVHRIECKKLHGGVGGFPCWLSTMNMMRNLFIDCVQDGIWVWDEGANVGEVLRKMKKVGGLMALTNYYAPLTLEKHVLPLRSWKGHSWEDDNGQGLSPERVAELLCKAPCVGTLFVVDPWYDPIDAKKDEFERVYSSHGCGRSEDIRLLSEDVFPDGCGWHAVVCVGYRFRDGRMDVLVLDNHTPWGPWRWVRLEEFDMMYTMSSLGVPPSSGRALLDSRCN